MTPGPDSAIASPGPLASRPSLVARRSSLVTKRSPLLSCPNATHRSFRQARPRGGRRRRRRLRLRRREGLRRGRCLGVCGHLAAGPQHFSQPARTREDGCIPSPERWIAAHLRAHLSPRRRVRLAQRCAQRRARIETLQGHRRLLHRRPRAAHRGRLRRPVARHRLSLAGQRARSEEAAARSQSRRLSRRLQRECLFARLHGAAPRAAYARGRLGLLAHVHGQ